MQYLMRIKNMLRPLGVTAIAAVAILLAGTLLFMGVWALLPDRTGETHSYAAPSFADPTDEPPALYPWNLMTVPMEDPLLDTDELCALLDPFLAPQLTPPTLHVLPYLEDWGGGEFLCNEAETLFGFRDVNIWVRTYSNVIIDSGETLVSADTVLQYRFSLVLREGKESAEVCFVSLEPQRKDALPAAEEEGLSVLTEAAKIRDLNLESGSPFAVFLWRFVDFCAALECDYTAYNAAMLLYETGSLEPAYVDHVLYCTFTGKEGTMTLLCDPVYQTVYGISLQRN